MKDLFQKVKDLKLPIGKYVIFGSGPMCARDLRDCHDIDILASEDIYENFKNSPEWKIMRWDDGDEYLTNGEIEVVKKWGPGKWNVKELIKSADIINELPFVKLESVLKWKRIYGREKDLKDAEVIEKFLQNNP